MLKKFINCMQNKIFLNIVIISIIGSYVYLLFFQPDIQGYFYTITYASVFYLIAIAIIGKIEISFNKIIQIIFIILLLKIIAIFYLPIGSDDYYRYLWDGKVTANGINPFQFSPNATELNNLHSDQLPEKVSYPHLKTIYFPLSQAAFLIAHYLSGETATGLKIILLISDILITIGLFILLRKFKIDIKYILIYLLSPLIFSQFFIDAHIDLLGIMFFVFTLSFYKENKLFAALMFGASLAVKPTFLVLLPIFFFAEKKFQKKMIWALIPIVFLIVTFIPFSINTNPFESLINFSKNWYFNGLGFNIIKVFISSNITIRILLLIIFLVIYTFILIFNKNLFSSIYYSLLILFLLSPVAHPWYVTWLIIPLIVNFRMSGLVFLSTISLTFYTVVTYQHTGMWKEYNSILLFEYIPVIVFLLYELYKAVTTKNLKT